MLEIYNNIFITLEAGVTSTGTEITELPAVNFEPGDPIFKFDDICQLLRIYPGVIFLCKNINSEKIALQMLLPMLICSGKATLQQINAFNQARFGALSLGPIQAKKVASYKPPIRVLFCGCRTSYSLFDELIMMELRSLPPYSTVFVPKGNGVNAKVNLLAHGIDRINVMAIEIDQNLWIHILDLVIAFHADIGSSLITKKIVEDAKEKRISVHVHDTKRKMIL